MCTLSSNKQFLNQLFLLVSQTICLLDRTEMEIVGWIDFGRDTGTILCVIEVPEHIQLNAEADQVRYVGAHTLLDL